MLLIKVLLVELLASLLPLTKEPVLLTVELLVSLVLPTVGLMVERHVALVLMTMELVLLTV